MTLEEFMEHAADAAYLGDAGQLEGYAREVFDERDKALREVARLRVLLAERPKRCELEGGETRPWNVDELKEER